MWWVIGGLLLAAVIAIILYYKKQADLAKQKADELASLAAQNTAPQGLTNIWEILAGIFGSQLPNLPQ